MPEFIELTASGGSASATSGAQSQTTASPSRQLIYQIAGLVPMNDCDESDCREDENEVCYLTPAFGHIVGGVPEENPTYENDINGFLIGNPLNNSGTAPSFTFVLQKAHSLYLDYANYRDWEWEDVANMIDDTYGTLFPFGSIPDHPAYAGYDVNWAKVINLHGPGIYRVKGSVFKVVINITMVGGFPVPVISTQEVYCRVSEMFHAQEWDCEKADGTVKFETSLTGSVGSIDEYYTTFNMCGFKWYDSIRLRGFFGEETTPKYEELNLEYQSGQLEQIHNKAINRFKFRSYYLPKWVHDRLKSYMMMADTILVSDYNYGNSDYFIKRKGVRPAGSYEPEYLDRKFFTWSNLYYQRRSKVVVEFRESVESVIKSLCCPCP